MEVVGPGVSGFIEPAEMQKEAEGVVERTCGLRGQAGEALQQNGCTGLPVATALERVGAESFGYITLPRTNGTTVYLSEKEIEEPTTVFEGDAPPLFFVDKPATRFFRPPKAGDSDDVNAEDSITTQSGEALTVGVHEGRVLEVQVTPSTTSTTAGSSVQFEAAVVGGGEFNFAWTFGDGTTATGQSVPHAFTGVGTYLVRVTATGTGGDESGGESGPVEVVVGNPPTTDAPGATTTPQPSTATPTGAPGKGREGRGGKGSKPAPSGEHKAPKPKQPKDDSSAQRGASPKNRSPTHASEAPQTPTSSPPPELPASGLPKRLALRFPP